MNKACWQVFDDDDALSLQIELGNNHAVTLTVQKDRSEPPSVGLWWGNGEHPFTWTELEWFRAWLDRAQGHEIVPSPAPA